MLKERGEIWRKDAVNRILLVITIVLIGWPWLSSIVLAGLSFVLPPETVERGSLIPVWTALGIPIGVGAAMAVYAGQRTFAASQKPSTS